SHDAAGSDLDVVSDANISQDLRARSHHHAVAQRGVALTSILARTTQSYALIQQHVITDFRGLTNHDAHSVIDEETASDASSGMDLYAGNGSRELAHHARGRIPSGAIEPVREAMQQNGMHAGITQQDFEHTACGRVTPEYRIDLLPQCAKHV